MLGPHGTVAERQRLTQRQLEHLLCPRRERDLTLGPPVTGADDLERQLTGPLKRDFKRPEHADHRPLVESQQPEQLALGPDVVVPERARLDLGVDDDLASRV